MMPSRPERDESLWWLTVAPTAWIFHFLASYVTAAVWCARQADPAASLGLVRAAVAGYTVVSLVVVLWSGRRGYHRHARVDVSPPYDLGTADDRHGFLGLAMLLLAGLSTVAILYVALVAAFFESCC